MDALPINWAIIKHPANWAIIILMVVIASFAFDVVFRAFFQPKGTANNE